MSREQERFQVLALSGGGYRGLYTAKILADIEDEIGGPIARHFDLIAGTSIGGILALALALEIPAKKMVKLFEENGGNIFKRRWSLKGILRAPYSGKELKQLLSEDDLFGDRVLGSCLHPVIIPSISYTNGMPVLFKTPHHPTFKRDHRHRIVDIAMATSAAPSYFPRYTFDNNQYVDGGLYANAPGLLAVHEANCFLNSAIENIHLMSIGTMSSRFTVDPRRNRAGGTYDWGGLNPSNMPKKLFGLSISVQESLSDFMLCHRLTKDRYYHVDDNLTDETAKAVALDKADAPAREALLGSASQRSKACLGDPYFLSFLKHKPATPCFFYGVNANLLDGSKVC
ncbi:putative sporulation hydrolase CotR [Janthinobacterium sp. KBS0711]|uniref:CBASS cGAMP-activated phospholipase n=1 Tax=Janthinobacterium sp. KBS0711 TaxID=1649647 RepID=UPI00062E90B1|nr:CBASS cGAMP-activated phospholipase [Janthinobacterium sp. KBS0711]KKO62259.1 putative sporulation hydrolase CotR [Janthinobacterium sp. KBS0711]TSD72233.1 patatin [Janthinobacterium sp. KBS0711]